EVAVLLVAHRGLADDLAPFVGLGGTVAVGRTMKHYRGDAVVMCLGDALDELDVIHHAKAFVVDYHVVALRPIEFLVDADPVALVALTRGSLFMNDGPLDVGPLADAGGENRLLVLVVVAAT